MDTAKIFTNGRSQAVRLPKEFRFDDDEVFIKRVGDAVVLLPRRGWGTLFAALDAFEPGFSITRDQPEQQDREPLLP
jgi:antitoxin VapB